MYYFFFYTFIVIAVVSSILIVFSDGRKLSAITIFILSVSGILALINAGYTAYILMFSSLLYYSIKKIRSGNNRKKSSESTENYFTYIIIISIFGAVLASVAGSTLWQGKVLLHKEISIGGILELTVNDYFLFFLLMFSAVPLLSLIFKRKAEL